MLLASYPYHLDVPRQEHVAALKDLSTACRQPIYNDVAADIDDVTLARLDTLLGELVIETHTLEDAVGQFLARLEGNVHLRVCLNDGIEQGLSNSLVFFAHDEQDNLKFVVKTFVTKTEFLREIFGIRLLEELNLEIGTGTQLLDAGFSRVGSAEYLLLALSPAAGESITRNLIHLSKSLENTRETLVHNASTSMRLFGIAMAELHEARQAVGTVPPLFKKMIDDGIQAGLNKLRTVPIEALDPNHLESVVMKLWKKQANSLLKLGLIHMDASPENIFVDLSTSRTTFIDLSGMFMGQNQAQESVGLVAYDVIHALTRLSFKMNRYGLTIDEQKRLFEAFDEGYLSKGGVLPTPAERELYLLWEALRMIGRFWGTDTIDHERRERIQELIEKLKII